MIADYFTNPLQGAFFHMFRNVIIGWAHNNTVYTGNAASKEHIGNINKKLKFDTDTNADSKAYTKDELLDGPSKAVKKTKSYAEAENSQNKIVMKNWNKAYGFNDGGALIN